MNQRNYTSQNKAILMSIAGLLYDCATNGTPVRLVKVLGHSNLYGNDCADAGATAVAKGDVTATVTETADNAPFDRYYWLRSKANKRERAGRDPGFALCVM